MADILGNSKEARGWGRRPRGEVCRMRWKGGPEGNRWAGGTQTSVTEGLVFMLLEKGSLFKALGRHLYANRLHWGCSENGL